MSCGASHRQDSDPALLRLWCRLAARAPIQSLAWELPYTMDVALKSKKKKRKLGDWQTSCRREDKNIALGVGRTATGEEEG